jgi:hypothetical protein
MPPKHCTACGVAHGEEGERCKTCEKGAVSWASTNLSVKLGGRFHAGGWLSITDEEKPARVDESIDADRAPDLIENVLAWRGWDVTPTGHLTASAVQGVWDPGANKAVCRHAGHTEDVPAVGCGCGFYGWHQPNKVTHGQIRGAIKCWGEIIVHDVGVRAEWAEILCLFQSTTHEPWLQRAAERYEVPIVETQAEAEALVADLGIRVPESMRPGAPPEPDLSQFQAIAVGRSFLKELPSDAFRPYIWGSGHGHVVSGYRPPDRTVPKDKAEELAQRRKAEGQQRAKFNSWDFKIR